MRGHPIPSLRRRYRARDGLYYYGYFGSPDHLEDAERDFLGETMQQVDKVHFVSWVEAPNVVAMKTGRVTGPQVSLKTACGLSSEQGGGATTEKAKVTCKHCRKTLRAP